MQQISSESAVATHPLAYNWTWSYKPTIVYKQQTAEDWLADYQQVIPQQVSTVEQFWCLFEQLPTLAILDCGNIYAMFRSNILASWEHPANADGYSVVLYMNKHTPQDYISTLYQNAMMILIGNNSSFSDSLNGCTFERKTGGNKIAFWMAKGNKEDQARVSTELLKQLRIDPSIFTIVDEDARIEWREPRFSSYKIAVKCVSHQRRANEPVIARRTERRSSERRRSTNGRRGGGERRDSKRESTGGRNQPQRAWNRSRQSDKIASL